METDAQITSWPGYDGIVREAGYTNATYPVTQNAEMACITGGVHIRLSAARAGRKTQSHLQADKALAVIRHNT
ncbi:hypothetical protein CRX54_03175 [Klebsiella oxytoca]|nr:hypothetical protein CRX54_03175 [Klebsiella oxytoca]